MEWASETDAERAYWWDAQHTPYACTPLATDYLEKVFTQPALKDTLAATFGVAAYPVVHHHGYTYLPHPPANPSASVSPVVQEVRDRINSQVPKVQQLWKAQYEPEIRNICRKIQNGQYISMALPDLSNSLRDLFDLAAGGFGLTFRTGAPNNLAESQLRDFCREEFDEDVRSLVGILEGGFANATVSADLLIWELADIARTDPAVMDVLKTKDVVAAVESNTPFSNKLVQYLNRFGSRAEVWFSMEIPTAKERPVSVLQQVQQVLEDNEPTPRLVISRSARIRRATTQRLRMLLQSKPKRLAEFNRVLANTKQHVWVKEGRALWQMTLTGILRIPCLAMGSKLVDLRILASPEDIFYLHVDEIVEIAVSPDLGNWQELVTARRREDEARKASNPPSNIGGEYEAAANQPKEASLALGQVLSGIPASAGVVEGRAIVVKTLSEAGKLETGDILICNSTSPAWSMLFSRISAVVTTGGGPLSHTAIVAREYKIPCVLNVEGVTVKIQDGMRIRVNGTKGTVELVG